MSKFLDILKRNILFILLICFFIVYFLFFGTAEVSGSSMFPTYSNEDFLILRKTTNAEANDIVSIYSNELDKIICKRVIGVEGDKISIRGSEIYVNDVLLEEPYIYEQTWGTQDLDCVVQDNQVFVLGDNRNNSADSRTLGCLNTSDIIGVSFLNITKLFGFTRSQLIEATFICWIILLFSSLFYKKK